MEEILKLVATYARGMWKYRWPALAVAWVVAAAGVVYIFRIPDVYQATARVHIDTQSILRPLMAGATIQPNVQQQVAFVSRTLISRPNVERLIRMADLDLDAKTKAEQEKLVNDLMGALRVGPASRGSRDLYDLSYRDSDRDKAQRVLEALVSMFLESSLSASRRNQDAAKAFLDQQIREHEQLMQAAEAKVRAFQLANIDRRLEEGGNPSTLVNALQQQLDQARLQLREAENARDAAKAQLEALKTGSPGAEGQGPAGGPPMAQVATPEIDARIAATQRNLDTLLLRYTEQHPDVVATRRLLRDLEAQKTEEVERLSRELASGAPSSPVAAASYSPFEQQLGQMVAAAEVQVASIRARVGELTARYQSAVASLRASPEIQAEFAKLQREYATHKRNYDSFVARRDKADLSGELEVAPGMAEFRLIEPPRVSPQPVEPNRLLLLPLPLIAGLAVGLVLAFLASQLRPVFHEGSELRTRTQLPLIGVVSAVLSDEHQRRHKLELIKFWSASGSLVLLFAAGMVVLALMAAQRTV